MDYYEKRDNLDDEEDCEAIVSAIQQSYDGGAVFITGASGLVGRVLLEKILRCCPGVDKVFILLRIKKGKAPEERLREIFEDEFFYKLRRDQPKFMSRVVSVAGDCSQPKCGMTTEDMEMLENEVTHVFHVAAALRMDEHLKAAYDINVRATKDLLQLATRMKKLKAFIYTSTAYSQTMRSFSEEIFYTPPYSDKEVKQIVETMTEYEVGCLTPKLMGCPEQNTYAFTKALAEDIVKQYVGKIPVGIIRPSIVIGCAYEPLICWINNIYGATGVLLAASIGLMRTWYCDKKKVADLIPADFVVNSAIASAWDVNRAYTKQIPVSEDYTPIYNIVSSCKAPMTWGDYMDFNAEAGLRDKLVSMVNVAEYNFRLQKSMSLYFIQVYFMHLIPALFYDLMLILSGNQPRLFKSYIKIHNFNMKLGYYCDRDWTYNQDNVDRMVSRMNKKDRKLFFLDMTKFDWKVYYQFCLRGLRLYILKDPMSTLEEARNRYLWRGRMFTAMSWAAKASLAWISFKMAASYIPFETWTENLLALLH